MGWLDPVPYSRKRLNEKRNTECPTCGPTTWIDSIDGFLCVTCGQDLEILLPLLCRHCKGRGMLTRGGWVAGWCSSCKGKGYGKTQAEIDEQQRKLAESLSKNKAFQEAVAKRQEKMDGRSI